MSSPCAGCWFAREIRCVLWPMAPQGCCNCTRSAPHYRCVVAGTPGRSSSPCSWGSSASTPLRPAPQPVSRCGAMLCCVDVVTLDIPRDAVMAGTRAVVRFTAALRCVLHVAGTRSVVVLWRHSGVHSVGHLYQLAGCPVVTGRPCHGLVAQSHRCDAVVGFRRQ